jgi:ABC-2 type transport system permease protein
VRLPEQTVTRPAGTQTLTGTSYYAPTMGIFFMFFAICYGARGFFLERTGGTLERLAAAPTGPGAILAGKSLTALVITVARTERQADGFASLLTFGLVLLDGNFVFIGSAPPLVRTLALLTPNGWALRAFTDLAGGAAWTAAAAPLMAILAFAAVIGAAAFSLRGRVADL